jgi:hypothetical protein
VSAYVEPAEVTIEIAVTPQKATLSIDGVKTDNPHRVKLVPGKFVHEIRAEAEGFESRSMSVIFDRDRSIDIALPAKPPTFGAVAPRGPGPAAPGSNH